MKRKIMRCILCLLLILPLLLQGCADEMGGGSTPSTPDGTQSSTPAGTTGKLEPWTDSMGTTQTIEKEDGGKKLERYDHSGRLVRVEDISKDGKTLNYYRLYEYDADGNLVREAMYGKNNDLWESCEYKYDSGKLTNKLIKDAQGVVTYEYFYNTEGQERYHCGYDYDEKGRVIEIRYFDSTNEGLGYVRNTYDDSDKIIRREELTSYQATIRILDYYADGTYDETKFIKLDTGILYDSRKLVTRFDANDKKLYSNRYKGEELDAYTVYNDDGSGTTEFYYLQADLLGPAVTNIKYVYTFDKDEQFVKETGYYYEDGSVSYIKEGTYDDAGKLTGKILRSYWRDGVLGSEYELTLDDKYLSGKNYTSSGFVTDSFVNQLNENGICIRSDVYYYYEEDSTMNTHTVQTFYEDGRIKSEMYYNYKDVFEYGYTVDEEGVSTPIYPD